MTHFGTFVFGFSNLTFSLGILMTCLSTFFLFSFVLEKVVLRRVICSFVSNKIWWYRMLLKNISCNICVWSWEWKTLEVNVMVTQDALQWRKRLAKCRYWEVEACWMCLRLCEHEFPFLLTVLTVEALTGGQLLHIIKKQQQQPLLFSYTSSDSAGYIWISVIKSVLYRVANWVRSLSFGFILWLVTKLVFKEKISSLRKELYLKLSFYYEDY